MERRGRRRSCFIATRRCWASRRSHPAPRQAPLPDGMLSKLVTGVLQGRGSKPVGKTRTHTHTHTRTHTHTHIDCPIEGDLILLNDGGPSDEGEKTLSAFRAPKTLGDVSNYLEHWEALPLRVHVPKWIYFGLKVVPVWVLWGLCISI